MRGLLAALVLTFAAPPALGQPTARFADLPAAPPERPSNPTEASAPPKTDPAPGKQPSESWATRAARERVRRAHAAERRNDVGQALREYGEALRLDGTYGPALLGLAELRTKLHDFQEAERLYARAARLPQLAADALAARADLRRKVGREQQALADLRASVERDATRQDRVERLARWYVEKRQWPAALALWRMLLARFESNGSSDAARKAHLQVRALRLLAGVADPVTASPPDSNWVRRSLAAIAERRGR